MNPRPLIFLALAFLLAAPLRPTARAADPSPLDPPHSQAGMTIALPKGWTVDQPKSGRTILIARPKDPEKDDSGEFPTTLSVALASAAKPDGKALQDANAHTLQNYKPVEEPRDIQIGGAAGVVLGGTFTRGALKLRTRQYVLVSGDKAYILTIVMLESRWDKYHQLAESAVASFQIAAPDKK
jgi:hypothetical protein